MFRPEEDTRGYFVLMQGPIEHWGLPLARYGYRHGVFKFSGKLKRSSSRRLRGGVRPPRRPIGGRSSKPG